MHRFRFALPLFCLLLTALLISPATTLADDSVVGNGTPASCNEVAFDIALNNVQTSGGGTITFDCGGAATIVFSAYKQISSDVTIDGGGDIIFDGNNLSSFFQVSNSASMTLTDIALRRGSFNGVHPLENFGALTLDNVTLSQSSSGGSPIANSGTLTISNSTFSDNGLTGNAETAGGVIINEGGSLTIDESTFNNNIINGSKGMGGAIAVPAGELTITDSTFANNRGFNGGAIYLGTSGSALIIRADFTGNIAGAGGAIESNGTNLSVESSTFTNNQAVIQAGGAIFLYNGEGNTISHSEFTGNSTAGMGGAVSCLATRLQFINSTFSGNEATSATLPNNYGGAVHTTCDITMFNGTFTDNLADDGGGAIYKEGNRTAELYHLTVVDNSAAFGAGIYNNGSGTGTMEIFGSIVAYNSSGNCDGVIVSLGYNLTNNTDCGTFTEMGDAQNANVPVLPLGRYGGVTRTRPPTADSVAIDRIPIAVCDILADQRGVDRPQGALCDSGAVEGTVYSTYLSLIGND